MTARHTRIDTALGELTVVAAGDAITGIFFPGHRYPPDPGSTGTPVAPDDDPLFVAAAVQLTENLAGTRTTFDLAIRTAGDPFSERVWAMLREIPYGRTTTYGQLADRLGRRTPAQAVGRAVGHNPISIVIPCHRVVGHDGRLTGYAGGPDRKRRLLDLEQPVPAEAGRLF